MESDLKELLEENKRLKKRITELEDELATQKKEKRKDKQPKTKFNKRNWMDNDDF